MYVCLSKILARKKMSCQKVKLFIKGNTLLYCLTFASLVYVCVVLRAVILIKGKEGKIVLMNAAKLHCMLFFPFTVTLYDHIF